MDFKLTSIARAGIDFANGQTAAEATPRCDVNSRGERRDFAFIEPRCRFGDGSDRKSVV